MSKELVDKVIKDLEMAEQIKRDIETLRDKKSKMLSRLQATLKIEISNYEKLFDSLIEEKMKRLSELEGVE